MKSREVILESDPRFGNMVGGVDANGAVRLMNIGDLYDLMEEIQIGPAIPRDIAEQFDKARHAFIYSWFAYDLVSLAEQQGYQTLELALREKLSPAERTKADAKRWGLDALLKHAIAQRWLIRSEFLTADGQTCVLDFLPRLRNELAHGSRNLFPGGSIEMLHLCAEILNKLFEPKI
jgi:hypothetical protein